MYFIQDLNKLLKKIRKRKHLALEIQVINSPVLFFTHHPDQISLASLTAPHAKTEDKGINMTSFITPVKF